MVGQEKNKKIIYRWKLNKAIPRFIIIEGDIGSGRYTLSHEIFDSLKLNMVVSNTGIDDIKEVINQAYKITSPTVYVFRDIDNVMSYVSQTLLKVVEESPNKAYFVMTVSNIHNIAETLISRATVLTIQPYTKDELLYFTKVPTSNLVCTTPGQLLSVTENDISMCVTIKNQVFKAIKNKDGTELLKCLNSLKLKDTDTDKIDCKLFLKTLEVFIVDTPLISSSVFSLYLTLIENCKKAFSIKSVNKKSAIEVMLLNLMKLNKQV